MKLKILILMLLCLILCSCSDKVAPMPLENVDTSTETLSGEYIANSQVGDIKLTFRDNNTVNYSASAFSDTEEIEGSYLLDGDKLIIKNNKNNSISASYDKKTDTITIEDLTLTRTNTAK